MSTERDDCELLEAAAKAAGYELCQWPDEDFVRAHMGGDWRPKWNPLTDDGDALRLAVKLRLDIYNYAPPIDDDSYVEVSEFSGSERGFAVEASAYDPYAAARRAITRAAAEIWNRSTATTSSGDGNS